MALIKREVNDDWKNLNPNLTVSLCFCRDTWEEQKRSLNPCSLT